MKKIIMLLLALSLAVVLAACNGDDAEDNEGNNSEEENQDEQASGQQEMPEPDLEGIPDVVAEVNGEEITREEFESTYEGQFQQMAMQSQMTGQELDQDQLKQQLAEGMVGTELITQEADKRDYSASDEEVDETLNEIAEQNEGIESKDEVMTALQDQGMGKDEIISQVKTQVKIDKLIAEESGDTEPSEEELKETYDQFKAQQEQMSEDGEQEIPSFEEMKPELETQVKNQKETEATQTIIEQLRENADVTINL